MNRAGELDGVDRRLEAFLARDAQLALEVQIGGRQEGVDARPLGRLERARRLFDVLRPVRASAAITGRRTAAAICRTASESAGDAIGNPASMMSTPSASSARAMASFAGTSIEKPGRLFAVAQRRVEDDDACRSAHTLSCSGRAGRSQSDNYYE